MSKFNTTTARPVGTSPITSERTASGRTYEGGAGYARDTKSELFLLAVSNMVGEHTFYESSGARDARYEDLVTRATLEDPEWTARLLGWLRGEGNMRSASLVGAATFAKARLDAGLSGLSRQVVDSVLQRADEPGEMLGYWTGRHGRAVPKPVKRGVADAVRRLYGERSLLKYDTDSKGFRFGDVLELVHASPANEGQGELFAHALDRRHQRDNPIPESLRMLRANAALRSVVQAGNPRAMLNPVALREAGMTWEDALSLVGSKVDKAALWAALVPSMGYMALLRNLRNFDEAALPDDVAATVAAKLADPDEVGRSRQFPFRFLSAYEAAPSLRWGHALDQALQHSLRNLPELPGRSLVLIDTSSSMTTAGLSAKSKVSAAKAAAVFGIALGAKGEQVDVTGFASGVFAHTIPKGGSVIREVDRFLRRIGEVGHGTDIGGALRVSYMKHDRVFIISDMQTINTGVAEWVPPHVPIYGFNLGGYQRAAMTTGSANRYEFGGLTDATFRMVPLLEAGRHAAWPF